MKAERLIFGTSALFFLIVAPAYWFITKEVIGSVALTLTFAFGAMLTVYFNIQINKLDPRPEDRKDGEIVEAAGEVGFFPSSSLWPFWCAVTIAIMSLGPVFGWWITLLGMGMGIWAVTGWCYQYYRAEYAH